MEENTEVEVLDVEDENLEGTEGAEDLEGTEGEAESGDEGADSKDDETARELAEYEAIKRENEELRRNNEMMNEAFGYFFEGDNPGLSALATARGVTEEELAEELKSAEELARLKSENDYLREQMFNESVASAMKRDLETIQGIDPDVKSLDELGGTFIELIGKGVDAETAYYATKAKEAAAKKTAPETVGKLSTSGGDKGYFTREEVEAMSPAEVSKNYDVIRKSMQTWK